MLIFGVKMLHLTSILILCYTGNRREGNQMYSKKSQLWTITVGSAYMGSLYLYATATKPLMFDPFFSIVGFSLMLWSLRHLRKLS